MEATLDIRSALIAKTLRVPALASADTGDSAKIAGQLDAALLSVGFTCSRTLLEHLASLHPATAQEQARLILAAARKLVGDDVDYNSYFIDFPRNVPDTLEFWHGCIREALTRVDSAALIAGQLASGTVNLLDLPSYGSYQHSYEDLLAAREAFIPSVKDRITVLELGQSFELESHALYISLASSSVPLPADELVLLRELAELHVGDPQPDSIDLRENRALVNRARLRAGRSDELELDAPLDVLRLACALSDGDVTLSEPCKLRSLPRAQRRVLMAALDAIIRANPAKLGDLNRYRERFKRLGERLHPHEFTELHSARDLFTVARGERIVRSLPGRLELALADGDTDEAITLLARAPGMLARSLDRLLRAGADEEKLAAALTRSIDEVSTRVLLALREHLANRTRPDAARIFVNQKGRAWVAGDERAPLAPAQVARFSALLDDELARRFAVLGEVRLDPAAAEIALPLSGKSRPDGLGVLPRGSVMPLSDHTRFFVYWHQQQRTTDYDLSALLLDENFELVGQVSWTNYEEGGVVYSGDIMNAPDGASEFIDIRLDQVDPRARYIVPQVYIYSGERFDEAKQAFFGFMELDGEQQGRPFEPRTVRYKSDLSGSGKVAMPVIFARTESGWQAKWMHLVMNGRAQFNRVENSSRSASLPVRAIVEREYLTLGWLASLSLAPENIPASPVSRTYIGLEHPANPAGAAVYTPTNLEELLKTD